MNEKELLAQLHNLKNTAPDHQWKNDNRDILLSQISSGEVLTPNTFLENVRNVFAWRNLEWVTEPAGVMSIIILVLFGGGVASIKAAHNTKPGDSFYIAKIISEKTKQAVTFNETEKAKLGIEFASNRTKEITQVLTETKNEGSVANLEDDFKKEIKAVKTRLGKMNSGATVKKTDNKEEEISSETEQIFSADSGRDEKGIQIFENATTTNVKAEAPVELNNPTTALEQAEKLFDQKDYNGTLDKLEEANAIIDGSKVEAQAVKTEEGKSATSTK